MASDEVAQEGKNAGPEDLTPAKRHRLEKVFEHASMRAGSGTNFDYATELFTLCVLGDPGNVNYVRGYIENLQKKYGQNRKGSSLAQFKERTSRVAQKKAVAEEQWYEVIRHGLKVLTVNPWDLQTLSAMATAAGRMGHRECELYYLKSALAANSKDPNINRQCAMLMTDLGQYDQAIVCWHRVEEALPDAEEPRRAIAVLLLQRSHSRGEFGHDDVKLSTQVQDKKEELSPEQILKRKIEKEPDQLAHYQELADFYIAQDHFREAEAVLAKAYRVSNEDPEVRDKWQDTQLRYLRQTIAKTHDLEKKKKYQRAYFEKELEVFKNRVERYPDNLSFKYELGYRYFLTKHYAEAIKELQAAKNDPRRKGVSLLALGQCFQHIKQFRLAMQHYEQALEEIPDRDPDNKKKSLYFAGRLALVLGDLETAESHLSNLAALDFTYNNVSALLDKIAKLRENPDQAEHHDETPDHNQGDS